jgi:EAL domain-containing protein (putative c-di-GMP-specific phosphodiesterase class I)
VETSAEESLLQQFRCDYAQGFLYARALPVAEIEEQLESWGRAAA